MEVLKLILNIPNFVVIAFGGAISWWFYKEYLKTRSHALLNSLPGVFTSLGLLGTFASICWSLYDVNSDNITSSTINGAAAVGAPGLDIKVIISRLIPAFTSSILGLLCALLATIFAKYVFAKEEMEEREKLKNRTPEQYIQDIAENSKILKSMDSLLSQLNKQLAKMITNQETQDNNYREYNDNLNNNIKHQNEVLKEFIDGFVNRMDDIFKKMNGAIEQQVKSFGEEQFTKTSMLLSTISENLSRVSTDIISQQKNSVEKMLAKTNEDIKGISTTVTTVLGKLTLSLQEALENLGTKQQDKLNEITSSVSNVLDQLSTNLTGSLENLGSKQGERLNGIIENYDKLATKLSEQNTSFAEKVNTQINDEFAKVHQNNTENLRKMTELQDSYRQLTSDMLTNALSMNETTTNNIRESLGGFVETMQSTLSMQCATLKNAISSNVDSLNKAYSFIESLVAEIKQNYDQAVLAYGDAVNIAHRTNESSEKAIIATSKSLVSVEETNNKIGAVLNILTERQENIENLTKQIGSISDTIISLQKLESALNKIVNR